MKDRIPTHPGRVELHPVEGQPNTYDLVRADAPAEEGTPLNKASLLKDSTAALFGLDETAAPDDVYKIIYGQKLKLLYSKTTAGAESITLKTDRPVRLIAVIIGGGGGGGASIRYAAASSSETYFCKAVGGGSGHLVIARYELRSTQKVSVVVGSGGSGGIKTYDGTAGGASGGSNGGTSSALGFTANGGSGGLANSDNSSTDISGSAGGQPSSKTYNLRDYPYIAWGGLLDESVLTTGATNVNASSFGFWGTIGQIFGLYPLCAGGSCSERRHSSGTFDSTCIQQTLAGLGGSASVVETGSTASISAAAVTGAAPGSGGGAAIAMISGKNKPSVLSAQGAAGAAGGVYIFGLDV